MKAIWAQVDIPRICRSWPTLLLAPGAWIGICRFRLRLGAIFIVLLTAGTFAQNVTDPNSNDAAQLPDAPSAAAVSANRNKQINVNWFYGSYVPKDVPLEYLDGGQRFKLYTRQTYMTWGIYIKVLLFTLHDQVHDSNPQWGDSWEGFGKRLGTREAQVVIQNTVTSLGDGLVGWEPRYDRCKCDGFWPRTKHAIARNFVTYARDEKSLRPQIMPYLGAYAGAAAVATWEPAEKKTYVAGYQGAITQVLVGIGVDWIGEFAPEIARAFHHKKHETATAGSVEHPQ